MIGLWKIPEKKTPIVLSSIDDFENLSLPSISDEDKEHIILAFKAKFYRSLVEFAYSRMLNAIKNVLKNLGESNINTYSFLYVKRFFKDEGGIFTINNAERLGLIDKQEKLEMVRLIQLVQQSMSIDAEELEEKEVLSILQSCVNIVFIKDFSPFIESFVAFIDSLINKEILTLSKEYIDIIESAPKEQLLVVEELLRFLIKSPNAIIIENIKTLLPVLWDIVPKKQKINFAWYLDGCKDKDVVMQLVKLPDIDIENQTLKKVITYNSDAIYCHFAFNNSSNELLSLHLMMDDLLITNLTTGYVITPLILAYIGTDRTVNKQTISLAEKGLLQITEDKWNFFFKNFFMNDEFLLMELCSKRAELQRFCEMFCVFCGDNHNIDKELFQLIFEKNTKSLQEKFLNIYKNNN